MYYNRSSWAAKDSKGACNHNPNCVITFELNWHAYMVSNNEIVVSLYGNLYMVIMAYEFGL